MEKKNPTHRLCATGIQKGETQSEVERVERRRGDDKLVAWLTAGDALADLLMHLPAVWSYNYQSLHLSLSCCYPCPALGGSSQSLFPAAHRVSETPGEELGTALPTGVFTQGSPVLYPVRFWACDYFH